MAKKRRFEIDFFEFSFLVEACIPERPIARTMFWHNVIDKYYHELTPDERAKLFEWIQCNPQFDIKKEDCLWFYDRYNPDNQYEVQTVFKGKYETMNCFLHNDKYFTKRNTWIAPEYIIEVTKTERK